MIEKLTTDLNSIFDLKRIGSLYYLLGIEAYRDHTVVYLSQAKYISDLLHKLNMSGVKPCYGPVAPNSTLSKEYGGANGVSLHVQKCYWSTAVCHYHKAKHRLHS